MGSIGTICAIIAGLLVKRVGLSIWVTAPIAIAFGAGFGAINGVMVTKFRITSFIATLGSMWALQGSAFVLAGGRTVGRLPPSSFQHVLAGDLWGIIPMSSIWFVAITICCWIILEHTAYGNRVFATGGNTQIAKMLGVATDKVKIVNFILVAVFSVFGRLGVLSDVGQMSADRGAFLPFEAIAAVVIGGTSLFGGRGTVLGTFLGAFIMGGVKNGIMLLGFTGYWPDVFVGLVILAGGTISIIHNIGIERILSSRRNAVRT